MSAPIEWPITRPDLDICECGDFLRDHDAKGCKLCRGLGNGTAGMIPPCSGFRFAHHATKEDLDNQRKLEAMLDADKEWSADEQA